MPLVPAKDFGDGGMKGGGAGVSGLGPIGSGGVAAA